MAVKTVQDLINEGVEGRHVLVRADLNVPLKDGEITDPGRIDASVHAQGYTRRRRSRGRRCSQVVEG